MAKRKAFADHDPRWTSKLAPAPGDLKLVQAFLNTSEAELASPRSLAVWLEFWDLVPPSTELDDGDLERAVEVREALRTIVGRGEALSAAVRCLARSTAALRVGFDDGGWAHFETVASGLEGALSRLCGLVVAAQLEGTWQHLKICIGEDCRAAFFDTSKNQSGKWCSPGCCSRKTSFAYRRRNLDRIRDLDRGNAMFRRFSRGG